MSGYIREADDDDIPAILRLEALLFNNAMGEAQLARELEVGRGLVRMSSHAPLVLGYALLRNDNGLLDLTRLGVDPADQGTGIGTELLEHVMELGSPMMLTVRKDNLRALRLYLNHGFRVTGHFSARAEQGLECAGGAWVLRRDAGPW